MSDDLATLLTQILEQGELSAEATVVIEKAARQLSATPDLADAESTWDGQVPLGLERIGRYEDLGPLGAGAMGEVRRVRDPDLNRVLAMKIVSRRFLDNKALLARFVREAQATAQLQHPGIVPVHELGRLPDGRVYYTMREVRGHTLGHVLQEVRTNPEHGWTPRRLIDLLHRVCDAVAHAHARGVVHRDLKPDNVMVGHYGDVLVVDWGLVKILEGETESGEAVHAARATGELASNDYATRVGAVAGTPAYMAPEQARGQLDAIGPPSDVFALGIMLGELLGGAGPNEVRRGEVPASADGELRRIFTRAVSAQAEARFATAGELGLALEGWLEGARRRERALALVAEAGELAPEAQRLREQAISDRARAIAQQEAIPLEAPVSDKVDAWRLEDGARDKLRDALVRETEAVQRLQAALGQAPDLAEAHRALAESYYRQHRDAESRRDNLGAAQAEVFLRAHDDGRHAAYLRGVGAVTLVTDPPGATVRAFRYVEQDRVLELEPFAELGRTPLREHPLPMGSYLLEIEAPDRPVVRHPLLVERAGYAHGVPPGATEPLPIPLPAAGALGPDEVYVPPGWFWSGGDPKSFRPLPARRIWVDGFAMRRDATTCAEYIAFLNGLEAMGRPEEALRAAPRERTTGDLVIPGRTDEGRWFLRPDTDGFEWFDAMPVLCISWAGARAYAAWLSEHTGQAWALPWAAQTEKATRGADRRAFSVGDFLDPTWANTRRSRRGDPGPRAVGSWGRDVSPYGVRDLCGNAAHWCLDEWRPESIEPEGSRLGSGHRPVASAVNRAVRGGSWGYDPDACRSAYHIGQIEGSGNGMTGLRVVRWL